MTHTLSDKDQEILAGAHGPITNAKSLNDKA